MTFVELIHCALELQQKRCNLFHEWSQMLEQVAQRKIDAEHVYKVVRMEIIPQFQEISASMREVQQKVNQLERVKTSIHANNYQVTLLNNWIDRLQSAEKEHYAITVKVNVLILEHLHSNSNSNISSNNNNVENKDDLTTNKDRNNSIDNTSHLQNVCALSKIFAPHVIELLQFVNISDDNKSCYDDNDSTSDSDDYTNNDENKNSINNISGVNHNQLVEYKQCTEFTSKVEPLLERKKIIQAEIVELVDELQNELSDL